MADPTTINIDLVKPLFNDPAGANTWGNKLNSNFDVIDARLGGTTGIAVADVDVNMNSAEAGNINIVLSGNSAADLSVNFPVGTAGFFSVLNGVVTTNRVSIKVIGGAGVVLPQGQRSLVLCDGTNAQFADTSTIPPGTILPTAAINAPPGYIFPIGQILSAASYPGLYAAFGNTYNTGGESAGNFRVPDLRGRAVAGADNMGGIAAGNLPGIGIGVYIGEQNHILSVPEMPIHGHAIYDPGHIHGIFDPGHRHTYQHDNSSNTPSGSGTISNVIPSLTNFLTSQELTGVTVASAGTGVSINNAGGSTSHNNMQPTFVGNYIMKV